MSEKKTPMTPAERKRRSREMKRQSGLQQLEIEISYALKSKLEWSAKKEGVTLREYIAKTLENSHSHMA